MAAPPPALRAAIMARDCFDMLVGVGSETSCWSGGDVFYRTLSKMGGWVVLLSAVTAEMTVLYTYAAWQDEQVSRERQGRRRPGVETAVVCTRKKTGACGVFQGLKV